MSPAAHTVIVTTACSLLEALAVRHGWSESDIADGRAAIKRSPQDALALFTEILGQDIDTRVTCTGCQNFAHGKCRQHQRAGLHSPLVGRDLATIRQHCPAFVERPTFDSYQEVHLD